MRIAYIDYHGRTPRILHNMILLYEHKAWEKVFASPH